MTCRKAREFLLQHGAALTERDFFQQRFTAAELRQIIGDRSVADIFSWKSPSAKALGLKEGAEPPDKLLHLMLEEPRLIRRPLIVIDGELVIGFDQKRLAQLLT